MARQLDELAAEALELPKEGRAALAKRLLESLEDPTADSLGQGWLAEAERRGDALRAGNAHTISSEEVFETLESRHRS
jgi:putative addiction module component (TIGR02574 family)